MASVLNIPEEQADKPVLIRHVGLEYLSDIMAVMRNSFPSAYGESWNENQCRSMLSLPGSKTLAAYVEEQLCGFAISRSVVGEEELLMIAVEPDFQLQGVGRQLLDRLLLEAKANDVETVFLEVRVSNPAQRLYEKAGFKEIGRRTNYYTGEKQEKFDAITYKMKLT